MEIQRPEIILYESHWSWHTDIIEKPDWAIIKETILRMDKFYRPIVILVVKNSDALWLSGESTWHIQKYQAASDTYSEAVNPRDDDTEVTVWTSDQSFTTTWRHAFNDSEKVLEIVKHLCDKGEFASFVLWE
jgi:hypothetical protein